MDNKLFDKEYQFLYTNPQLRNNILFLVLSGSHMYGTSTPDSDTDIRGVALETKQNLLGLQHFEQFEDKSTDTVIYSFRRFVQLLMKSSPNNIELLFAPKENQLVVSSIGQELFDNRDLFLSKQIFYTMGGYARQQYKHAEQRFAKGHPQRNKSLMHMFRLYRECTELLLMQEIHFPLENCEHLLEIRNGLYEKDGKIDALIEEELTKCERQLQLAYEISHLPEKVDIQKIEEFQMRILEDVLRKDGN